MEILVENNAFHNIQNCLEGNCTDLDILKKDRHHQIEDLLQLCIQIIFYDTIHIAGNVPTDTWKASEKLRDLLQTKHKIHNVRTKSVLEGAKGKENAEKLIRDASDAIKANITNVVEDCFDSEPKRNNPEKLLNFFPSLAGGDKESVISRVTQGIAVQDAGMFDRYFKSWEEDISNYGGIIGVLSLTLDEIFRTITDSSSFDFGKWDRGKMLRLMVRIRTELNKALLSKDLAGGSCELSQSVLRTRDAKGEDARDIKHLIGRYVDIHGEYVLDEMEKILRENVERRTEKTTVSHLPNIFAFDVPMPSLAQYLIKNSGGNVEKMLSLTGSLHKEFLVVRKKIRQANKSLVLRDPIDIMGDVFEEIRKEIRNVLGNSSDYKPIIKNKILLTKPMVVAIKEGMVTGFVTTTGTLVSGVDVGTAVVAGITCGTIPILAHYIFSSLENSIPTPLKFAAFTEVINNNLADMNHSSELDKLFENCRTPKISRMN